MRDLRVDVAGAKEMIGAPQYAGRASLLPSGRIGFVDVTGVLGGLVIHPPTAALLGGFDIIQAAVVVGYVDHPTVHLHGFAPLAARFDPIAAPVGAGNLGEGKPNVWIAAVWLQNLRRVALALGSGRRPVLAARTSFARWLHFRAWHRGFADGRRSWRRFMRWFFAAPTHNCPHKVPFHQPTAHVIPRFYSDARRGVTSAGNHYPTIGFVSGAALVASVPTSPTFGQPGMLATCSGDELAAASRRAACCLCARCLAAFHSTPCGCSSGGAR